MLPDVQNSKLSPKNKENLEQYPDRIAESFKDKTLLITGGTGFLGKVLIEKLLRSCSEIKKIYVLIRPRKEVEPCDRLIKIFENPLFDLLRKQNGAEIFVKVQAIAGDVEMKELGLSECDRNRLQEEVEIIYHSAATIRFDDYLKKSVLLNVRGTKYMCDLAKACKKLMLFCHISTAFSHSNENIIYEKTYEPLSDPETIIFLCETLDTAEVEKIKKQILGSYPNSYGFTKALGEGIVNKELDNLPIIIVRPSIVVPVWREPLPGWTDNLNGPTGLLIGAGKGVIRTMYGNKNICADYIPVDIAVNSLLCIAYHFMAYRDQRIFNVTSSAEYKISFEEMIGIGREIIKNEIPLNWVLWYPGGGMTTSRVLHMLRFFFYQLLPAILIDALLILICKKPFLWRIQTKRIWRGYEVFEYYVNKQWVFHNEGSLKSRDLLNPREKIIYKVDGNSMNYVEYFTSCVYAARRYLLNETDDTIPCARRHLKLMWFLDRLCKSIIVIGIFCLLWNYASS